MSTALVETAAGPAQSAPADRAKSWIISPVWDLVFLIAAPLAIVPLVTLTAAHWLDVEEISLVVISFATLGHHLPGFLRAYGDRDLFSRFRRRFVWAPPLVFAVALFSAAWGLHGLALILLFWATWHGLMQTYGFMRIYDLKQGQGDRLSARLDFLLCVVIFTAGVIFSDARVYGIADTLSKTGLPLPGPAWLAATRWLTGATAALVICGYLVHVAGRIRRGGPVAWPRLALGLSTGWLYWLGGVLATDMLVGVATFEIFHALQYDAIVWAYNRGKARKSNALVRPLGAMFQQDRWASLTLYVALIAAFSSIRLMGEVASNTWLQRVLMALLTTSTFMHFYFDGFIWKVSERKTQDDLDIVEPRQAAERGQETERVPPAQRQPSVPPAPRWRLNHAGGCAALAFLAAGLIVCESRRQSQAASEQSAELNSLVALTPQLPELQWRVSEAALAGGDAAAAVDAASSAVTLRPNSQQAHARLGAALLATDRVADAAVELEQAARLGPRRWNNHCNLGIALGQLGRWDESTAAFRRADQLQPGSATIQAAWARMCERAHADSAASEHYRAALALDPADEEVRGGLVSLLSRGGQHDEATRVARQGLELHAHSPALQLSLGKALVAAGQYHAAIAALSGILDPNSTSDSPVAESAGSGLTKEQIVVERSASERQIASAACYETAVAQMQLGEMPQAAANLDRALKLDPKSSLAHFQIGNLQHARGDLAGAAQSYRRSLDLQSEFAPAHCNLGTVLMILGDAAHARNAYERALSLAPEDGSTHYNLGLLLLNAGQESEARPHLLRARELGVALPPALETHLQSTAP